MKLTKTWDELTIQDNFMFLKVMQDETLCRDLLERILNINISKITFPETEKNFDPDVRAKSVRLDVYVEDNDGRVFDIEMQAAAMPGDALALRTRYYQAMIDQNLLEKGQVYSRLRQSYIIFICAFDPFGMGLRRYTFRNRCDEQPSLCLPDRAVRIFFNAKGQHGDESPDVRAYLEYVRTNTVTNDFTAKFAAAVERIKADAKERKNYMTLAMDLQMYVEKNKDAWLAAGKAEGIAEGKAEGIAEGKAEACRDIALRMLQTDTPPEQISLLTGLSEEELRELRQMQ